MVRVAGGADRFDLAETGATDRMTMENVDYEIDAHDSITVVIPG